MDKRNIFEQSGIKEITNHKQITMHKIANYRDFTRIEENIFANWNVFSSKSYSLDILNFIHWNLLFDAYRILLIMEDNSYHCIRKGSNNTSTAIRYNLLMSNMLTIGRTTARAVKPTTEISVNVTNGSMMLKRRLIFFGISSL